MVGAVSIVGSAVVDSHTCPCLCLDALSSSGMNFKSTNDIGLSRNLMVRKQLKRNGSLELSSSFVDAWHEWRLSTKVFSGFVNVQHSRKQNKGRSLAIVDELGGQYEDSFEDVQRQMLNYFTYKAVRTVLTQLYEMNPTQYRWFYDFVSTNQPADGKRFIRNLVKEKQDLAERVMVTRLHLYGKWVKKCDHAAIYKEISDQNLELMRERLIETVIWPSDNTH
ncbi:chaperonin-like RbcX protein 2, chloroplastic [Macadamia integrifolia]|uniref:chaperonin-like RbcX protein 2, chloroplastic n=1 Tax=Macadamia integrifolia TaxID=60698 RepID=UPI001C4F6DA0|nr:chaperonin-like RbcX protein 2, chloroplastic [Macadamia integrifolia]